MPDLLTVDQAAQRVGLSPWTISDHCSAKHLPYVLVCGRRMIDAAELDRWNAERLATTHHPQSTPERRHRWYQKESFAARRACRAERVA